MRGNTLRRILQVGIVVAISTIMLGADAGLLAAAPGGQGRKDAPGQTRHDDGTRPGWGCGDSNHVHTGPPGRPDAESPCSKSEDPEDSQESPAAATHFVVSAPGNVSAGSSFSFTVTARDQNNNTVTSYNGTVHFTSSDGSATLPDNTALTNGTGTLSATLRTAGNQTITATDTSNSSITGTSGTISVSAAGAATHFAVSAPANATAGTAFSFTVTARDQFNNTVTSYNGTVHFTSSDGSATLPGDSALTNGIGTFSATLATVGNQTLTATDTSNSSIAGTSGTIAVSAAGAATHFAVSAPARADVGTAFNFTVTALDQNNQTVTSYSGTVRFTSSDGSAELPDDTTLTNGTGTFSATLNRRGNRTITATDVSNSSLTGTSERITVR